MGLSALTASLYLNFLCFKESCAKLYIDIFIQSESLLLVARCGRNENGAVMDIIKNNSTTVLIPQIHNSKITRTFDPFCTESDLHFSGLQRLSIAALFQVEID